MVTELFLCSDIILEVYNVSVYSILRAFVRIESYVCFWQVNETETMHNSLASIFAISKFLSLIDIQFYW